MKICKLFCAVSALLLLAACGGGDDDTALQVTTVFPADLATDVSTNTVITISFNETINAVALTSAPLKVEEGMGGVEVSGTITYDADLRTAFFTPTSVLEVLTTYYVTASASIADIYGNSLKADYSWQFSTDNGIGFPQPDNINGATAAQVIWGKTFWGLRTDGNWGLLTGTLLCDSDGDGVYDHLDACPDTLAAGDLCWLSSTCLEMLAVSVDGNGCMVGGQGTPVPGCTGSTRSCQ
jgi:hypothetical protein